MSFAKKYGKNIGKNLSSEYSQKLLDHTKESAIDALKIVLKRAIQETAAAISDLTGSEIATKITEVSKTLPQNSSETVESEKEIPKERYISPERGHKIIDGLRLI